MHGTVISNALTVVESVLCVTILICIFVRKQYRDYRYVCLYLGNRVVTNVILLPFLLFAGHRLGVKLAYNLYFYAYSATFVIESVLALMLIYSIFNLAMAPLDGLKNLGKLVFRWAASISIAIAIGASITPQLNERAFILGFMNELQRSQSILTLCLLIFVCFAIRPMGLSYSSRIFGISLGLGLMALVDLISNAWAAHYSSMYSMMDTVVGVFSCIVMAGWTAYFVLPEPKRRLIVLPTTSPFLRWNQISQVLGDDPGYVAIGGIPPELFAPAELEIMRRASLKMADQPLIELQRSQSA